MPKEVRARIKINSLLEQSGWHFFDSPHGKANISLVHSTKKGKFINDKLGNDLEGAPDGFIDYLLLNEQNRPVALVEAKRESIDPLNAKEQAREYARGQNIRHIFLPNGNVHYYWDLEEENPTAISRFFSLKRAKFSQRFFQDVSNPPPPSRNPAKNRRRTGTGFGRRSRGQGLKVKMEANIRTVISRVWGEKA